MIAEHLVRAAKARHDNVMSATVALRDVANAGEPITFSSVAREAGVSTDFLYNTPTLRSRITGLRGQRPRLRPVRQRQKMATSNTTAIRALSTQLKEQRRPPPQGSRRPAECPGGRARREPGTQTTTGATGRLTPRARLKVLTYAPGSAPLPGIFSGGSYGTAEHVCVR